MCVLFLLFFCFPRTRTHTYSIRMSSKSIKVPDRAKRILDKLKEQEQPLQEKKSAKTHELERVPLGEDVYEGVLNHVVLLRMTGSDYHLKEQRKKVVNTMYYPLRNILACIFAKCSQSKNWRPILTLARFSISIHLFETLECNVPCEVTGYSPARYAEFLVKKKEVDSDSEYKISPNRVTKKRVPLSPEVIDVCQLVTFLATLPIRCAILAAKQSHAEFEKDAIRLAESSKRAVDLLCTRFDLE